jgi:hypothetical protein
MKLEMSRKGGLPLRQDQMHKLEYRTLNLAVSDNAML